MKASYNLIQTMAAKLPHCVPAMELIDYKDPDLEKDPGGTPVENKNQLNTAGERWLAGHTTDSRGDANLPGTVLFRVTLLGEAAKGKTDASGWIDPVDENCTGCVTWAKNEVTV